MTSKEKYELLDKLNLCHKCHKEKRMPGYKLCPICIEKHINYNIEHGQWSANHKEEYSKKCKERYSEHKQNGICVKCNSPATHGIYCYKHSIAAVRYSIKRNERRKAERHEKGLITEKRIKEHLCYTCGKPLDDSRYKICNACRAELSRRSKLGNKDAFRKIRNSLFWENKK